jgi:ubiquinol-cytochrome c reductase cytochrome b subunit
VPPERNILDLSAYLPRLGLSCLVLCLLSGIILTFYYRPFGNVFQNVEEITTLVPFGKFIRQLHYGAGQLFVILMLLHTADHFLKKRYQRYPFKEWGLLIVSLSLCFMTLFTGFVLKGDKEGFFAGQILLHVLRAVPLVGEQISILLVRPGEDFFFLPYLYHCFFLPLAIVYLIKAHIREWLPDQKFLLIATIGLFFYALFVDPHIDIPPQSHADVIQGPWFFLGIQSLLRNVPPIWGGLIIPGLFLGCVLLLGAARDLAAKVLHYLVTGLVFFYGFLTVRSLL